MTKAAKAAASAKVARAKGGSKGIKVTPPCNVQLQPKWITAKGGWDEKYMTEDDYRQRGVMELDEAEWEVLIKKMASTNAADSVEVHANQSS